MSSLFHSPFIPVWSLASSLLLIGLAFLLRVRGAPVTSVQMTAMALLLFGFMDAAYAYGLAVRHPAAAYHRLITIVLAGPAWIIFARAVASFPNKIPGRVLNIVSLILLIAYFGGAVYFLIGALSEGAVRVHEHYWNFRVGRGSLVLALIMQLILLTMLVLGMTTTISRRGARGDFGRYVPVLASVWAFAGFLFAGSVFTLSRTAKVTLEVAAVFRFFITAMTFIPLTFLFWGFGASDSRKEEKADTGADVT